MKKRLVISVWHKESNNRSVQQPHFIFFFLFFFLLRTSNSVYVTKFTSKRSRIFNYSVLELAGVCKLQPHTAPAPPPTGTLVPHAHVWFYRIPQPGLHLLKKQPYITLTIPLLSRCIYLLPVLCLCTA